MALFTDALDSPFVGLDALAEVRRGFFLAMFDVFRIAASVVTGFAAYSLFHRLSHSYTARFIALGIAALAVVMLVPATLRLLKVDPVCGKTGWGRAAAGFIELVIGLLIAAVVVPVIGRSGWGREAVMRSFRRDRAALRR